MELSVSVEGIYMYDEPRENDREGGCCSRKRRAKGARGGRQGAQDSGVMYPDRKERER